MKIRRGLARFGLGEDCFNLLAKLFASGIDVRRDILRKAFGHSLRQQTLLALEHELLVAQRAHGEPGQNKARQEYREHKYQRNFPHSKASGLWLIIRKSAPLIRELRTASSYRSLQGRARCPQRAPNVPEHTYSRAANWFCEPVALSPSSNPHPARLNSGDGVLLSSRLTAASAKRPRPESRSSVTACACAAES